jgi:hypothetical protein
MSGDWNVGGCASADIDGARRRDITTAPHHDSATSRQRHITTAPHHDSAASMHHDFDPSTSSAIDACGAPDLAT